MKVSVIGAGAVGTKVMVDVFAADLARTIVLVDKNQEKAEGEVFDLAHTTSFAHNSNTDLIAGGYPETKNSDVIVITAGAQLKVGEDRNTLAEVNSQIVTEIANQCYQYSPEALVIIVTNPVDLNCYFAIKNSPYPKSKVISTGTLLDTARFMKILSEKIQIDPKNIMGYVLGEHGETASIPWSLVNVCGIDLDTYCKENGIQAVDHEKIRKAVVQAGYEIFRRKGNTNHGVAASAFRLIRAVQLNERSVLPVGCLLEGEYGIEDVVLGVPAVIGRKGIARILVHQLTDEESKALQQSAAQFIAIRDSLKS